MIDFSRFQRDMSDTISSFRILMETKETYYIDPPTKTILKNLTTVWIIFFITFLLTFRGSENIFAFFWIPMIIILHFYSDMWAKVGFSLFVYWCMNITVIASGFGISRLIHLAVRSIAALLNNII